MTFLKPHGTKTTSRANSPRMQMQVVLVENFMKIKSEDSHKAKS